MRTNLKRALMGVAVLTLLLPAAAAGLWYQRVKQLADPGFDAAVDRPAYSGRGPRVLVDEGHHNFHTAGGRYKPFVDLIAHDGSQVVANRERFRRSTLDGFRVLVIANAMGSWLPFLPGAGKPAFTDPECDTVREWVRAGGSLLLIADHEPAGAAAQALAARFGVRMSEGRAFDPANSVREIENPSWIVFTGDNGLLVEHAITRGRDSSEVVGRVIAFTGQSLTGPANVPVFLKLGEGAYDILPSGERVPAAGHAVGIAMTFGAGRAVVVGEAAMLTAQVVGRAALPLGMNYTGIDNRQLTLNIMRWLTGALT